jgi:hypothetical protein
LARIVLIKGAEMLKGKVLKGIIDDLMKYPMEDEDMPEGKEKSMTVVIKKGDDEEMPEGEEKPEMPMPEGDEMAEEDPEKEMLKKLLRG